MEVIASIFLLIISFYLILSIILTKESLQKEDVKDQDCITELVIHKNIDIENLQIRLQEIEDEKVDSMINNQVKSNLILLEQGQLIDIPRFAFGGIYSIYDEKSAKYRNKNLKQICMRRTMKLWNQQKKIYNNL
jgi:hypothetical protein